MIKKREELAQFASDRMVDTHESCLRLWSLKNCVHRRSTPQDKRSLKPLNLKIMHGPKCVREKYLEHIRYHNHVRETSSHCSIRFTHFIYFLMTLSWCKGTDSSFGRQHVLILRPA